MYLQIHGTKPIKRRKRVTYKKKYSEKLKEEKKSNL